MDVSEITTFSPANEEAIEAWDGPLFDRFLLHRDVIVRNFAPFSDEALRLHPPQPGDRVLDIGCGFGETTAQIAGMVGDEGRAIGIDAAPRFIELAAREAREAGLSNAEFRVADLEATTFTERFDRAFSRFGTMFFANPTVAMRHVREALVPGGELVMIVWRAKDENEWAYRAQRVTERFVVKPEEYDDPTCGPGPFSMANADTASGILMAAGFTGITLRRCDFPMRGGTLDQVVQLTMDLGPAGEILRLAGDRAADLHEPVRAALREAMAEWEQPDGGMSAPASVWIVSAQAPA